MRSSARTFLSLVVTTCALGACDSSTPVVVEETKTPPKTTAASASALSAQKAHGHTKPADAKPSEPNAGAPSALSWTKPDAWTVEKNASSMRKATFGIPKAEGDPEDGVLTIMQVGGSIERNIERWSGQFGGAKPTVKEMTVGELKVTDVTIYGTFAGGGMMMAPKGDAADKKDWAMRAAIAHTSGGNHFFKLTGPKKTVDAAGADFDKLVASLKGK